MSPVIIVFSFFFSEYNMLDEIFRCAENDGRILYNHPGGFKLSVRHVTTERGTPKYLVNKTFILTISQQSCI